MSRTVSLSSPDGLTVTLRLPPADGSIGMPQFIAFGLSEASDAPFIERASRINGMDDAVASAVLLPTGGMGFFGWPAICGHRSGRDFVLGFCNWTAEESEGRLALAATDTVARMSLRLTLSAHKGGVVSSQVCLTNDGDVPYQLDRCMAGSFPTLAEDATVESFTGMWGREFQTRREKLGTGIWLQENRRGRTSHDRFPMLFVESANQRFGVALGFSGNHQIVIDRCDDGRRLVHMGELFEPGEMLLDPGESYLSPLAYAGADSAAFHSFVRQELITWPGDVMTPRPVTLNTWEGNYFDHKVASLKDQASKAAELGIERFVLDDGWFARRDDDTTSLGDWDIDTTKYPDGLAPLVDHVTSLGMEFGLWFEPEMVNPTSRLFETHPEWVLQVEGRPLRLSRHQLVLDLTRSEVADYLFAKIDSLLSSHDISYIKWDMNRDLTHVGGRDGKAATARQMRALYGLMDRIRRAHPKVEIESCASGGGRVDYGVLKYTHRVWTSDCTDALERLEIQHGASKFFPPELLGAHVSASPNHQTGRQLSLSFRSLVAMAYHFGVELNPLNMTLPEQDELAQFIALHKRLRKLLHALGTQFRLDPVDGRYVWGAASAERIAVIVAQGSQMVGEQPAPLRLPTHITQFGGRWRIADRTPQQPDFIRISEGQSDLLAGKIDFSLVSLTSAGLPLPMLRPESALLIELEPTTGDPDHG
ncbi:alpha-galactosidase [Roseibium sp.]|uniref:alpha-galactosidase n=1 Tax=Roseibium sp. TaxID=1936156 RepID=UPI003A96AD50